ncbi:MAG: uracil phosphoribosyltransferase [Bdellovibrionota bacterium]
MSNQQKIVKEIKHPLIAHKLTLMRDKNTSIAKFRSLIKEVSLLLGYEATRKMQLDEKEIETPLEKAKMPVLRQKKSALISVLRAGNGILDGMIELMPTAHVGHIGLYRDPNSHSIIEYYLKFPKDINQRSAMVLDPMLATGYSAVTAVKRLKQVKPTSIEFICIVASPEGIQFFHEHHPDVPIITASIDRELNSKGYILPGLGDAGDRLFGTQ